MEESSRVDGRSKTILSMNRANLSSLLTRQLLTHQFAEAGVTMETFALSGTMLVTSFIRKFGLEILLHDSGGETFGECLQFYKLLSSWLSTFREELLVEMVLYIASQGTLQEAYDNLQSYTFVPPFRRNPLVHGYCGLLQYLLWRRERGEDDQRADPPLSTEADFHSETSHADKHMDLALQHYQVLQTDKTLDGELLVNDPFVITHAELLVARGDEREALELLQSNREQYPRSINANRYVCDHLRMHHHDDRELRLAHLRLLVGLDESCGEAVELAELMMLQEVVDHAAVMKFIVCFLDYPCNGSVERAWGLLKKLQSDWPSFSLSEDWQSRLGWWSKLYPERLKTL